MKKAPRKRAAPKRPAADATPPAPASAQTPTLALLVRQVRDALYRRFEQEIADHGYELNLSQFMVVKTLGVHGACSPGTLARTLDHDPGALTRVLDRLVDLGLIRRKPVPGDRRALHVQLTARGDTLWDAARASSERASAWAMRNLKPAERRQLLDLLARVRASVEPAA